MKKSRIVVSLLLGLGMLSASSCGKSSNTSLPISRAQENTVEVPAPAPTNAETKVENKTEKKEESPTKRITKAVNLRSAEAFAILAHESIHSNPSSTITGKVGLRPGTREMIGLDPSEVAGGMPEIMAGDDHDKTVADFLTKAKLDMINAYNATEITPCDTDKINLFTGYLGGKVLGAGIYYWNSRVTIPLDLKLEGTENDVFIFKVAGDLRVGSDVKVTLSGGAKASNVFWIVGDHVLIKEKSSMVGTIISQDSFEMRESSSLLGRAFVKNIKLILDKSTITKP